MSQYSNDLKRYANQGLRTPADWATLGRVVTEGVPARVEAEDRTGKVALFSRDQTQPKPKSDRHRKPAEAPAAPAAV